MRRLRWSVMALLLVFSMTTSAVFAANVHFKGGNPTFTDLGTTLNVSGALAGLGNEDVTITLTATGPGTSTCVNNGGNAAPGQNKVPLTLSGSQTISAGEVKNGNVSFDLTTAGPTQPTAQQAGCPNGNWSATVTDVQFSSATITVVQGGEVVLQRTFQL
jgi:hypothetical protein